jgi:cadherin 23
LAGSGQIVATDADSGRFGQIEYALRGFGAEKFVVDTITGEITVNSCGENVLYCLDFESQKRYSLTYTGTDGGGQVRVGSCGAI